MGLWCFEDCTSLTSITLPYSLTKISTRAFDGCTGLKEFKGKYAADNGRCLVRDKTIFEYAEGSGTEYTIPQGITTIGEDAFAHCVNLESVTLTDNVAVIDKHAFYFCKGLKNVYIPDSVTAINEEAFAYSRNLESITLPESLMVLQSNAFSYCSKLASVYTINPEPPSPDIDDVNYWRAFTYTSNSLVIYIPKGSMSSYDRVGIGWGLYSDRMQEYEFEDSDDDPNIPNQICYTTTDGKIATLRSASDFGANLISHTYANGKGVMLFDNDVTKLANATFFGCATLATVELPESITRIGRFAFCNCTALTEITIPSNVTVIEEGAFREATNLKTVHLNERLRTIEDYVFWKCSSIESMVLPESLRTMWGYAFADCTSLRNIALNEGLTTILDSAFAGCDALQSVVLPTTILELGNSAFKGCTALKQITIPKGVTTLGNSVFRDCTSLATVELESGITNIPTSFFAGCTSLTEIDIPHSVTTISSRAFDKCTGLERVDVGANTETVQTRVFSECSNLKEVKFGNKLTSIGDGVFYGCSSLATIHIPESLTSIGTSVFVGCDNLTSFTGKGATSDGRGLVLASRFMAFAPKGITDYTVPSNVSSIANDAFRECKELKNISISNSVTSVGQYAFSGCPNLVSTSIGKNVVTIGTRAFAACPNIASVYCLPTITPMLESNVFLSNAADRKIYVPEQAVAKYQSATDWSSYKDSIEGANFLLGEDDTPALPIPDSNAMWYSSSDGNIVKPYDTSKFGVSVISNTYSEERNMGIIKFSGNLTTIGDNAFRGATTLTSVSLPETVTTIGDYAFYGCGLTEITIPAKCWGIGDYAFYGCSAMTKVDLGDVKIIGSYAFKDCSLTSVYIPEHAESFGVLPFKCSTLQEFTGPNIKGDGRSLYLGRALVQLADASCKGMKSYTVPSDVLTICEGAFQGYSNLRNVTISEGVQNIQANAFDGCSNLTKVILPSTLSLICNRAFANCSSLKSLYFNSAEAPMSIYNSGEKWELCSNRTVIRVAKGSLATYTNQYCWMDYNVVEFEPGDYSHDDVPSGGDDGDDDGGNDGGDDGGGDDVGGGSDNGYGVVNGAVATLQRASEGRGIDIIIMGDGYTASQIASGKYRRDLSTAIEALFSEEPYTSFRHLFNVYEVTVVSPNAGYGNGDTALEGFFGDGTLVGGNHDIVAAYAELAVEPIRIHESLIIVIMNRAYYAGTCYMFNPIRTTDYGTGASMAYFPLGTDDEMFSQIVLHEAGGHGFAKLADEYAYESMGRIPAEEVIAGKAMYEDWGWMKNVDYTSNTALVRWSKFINDTRYYFEGLGAYEGGDTYWKGVWRPTYNSIMRDNTGGFNAPSREAIYYRIHKLAYGNSWRYSYENFVAWDSRNRRFSAPASHQSDSSTTFVPLHPPVVVSTPLGSSK